MGDESPPPPPQYIAAPPPPTPSQTTGESLAAQLQYSPQFFDLAKTQMPEYAQLMTDTQKQQVPQQAQLQLDTQKQFAPQLVDLALSEVKQADPTGFAIRENEGQQILSDVQSGGELSPEERRLAEQDIRASQQAKGLGTGLSDSLDEARYLGAQRYQRKQQALSNAGSFVSGKAPQNQFALNPQATMNSPDSSGFVSMLPSTNQLISQQIQGYGQQSQNIANQNSYQMQGYNTQVANTTNPFLTGLGMAGGMAGNIAGMMGGACWVAREVYGVENARWMLFRKWMLSEAPSWFRALYLRFGERVAAWIADKPRIKDMIRGMMNRKLLEVYAL